MGGTAAALQALATKQLAPLLDLSGYILYSSVNTLRPGAVYLLGLNPGGSPEDQPETTIRRHVAAPPSLTLNHYLDSPWGNHTPGQHPLQRRVVWLLEQLGLNPRDVACSNLIFPRSQNARGAIFKTRAPLCWPVHEFILSVVRPSLVITETAPHRGGFADEKYVDSVRLGTPS